MVGNKKAILGVIAAMTVCSTAFSGPVIQQGINFFVSSKGEAYFKTNLESVFLANQIDLREMNFDDIKFELEDPFNADKAPKRLKETKGEQIERVTKTLGVFFKGIPVFNPVFAFSLPHFTTLTKFKSMGMLVDPKGPAAYGKKKGVILLMQLESADFQYKLPKLDVVDKKNPEFLGVMGGDGINVKLMDGAARPIRVEIPIWVDTNEKGVIIQALSIRSNIQKVLLSAEFKSLRIPEVEIIVRGKHYPMQKAEFEKEVRKMMPDIVDLVASGLKTYFEKDGGKLLQEKFDGLAKLMNTTFDMSIPEAPAGSPPITLALQPTDVKYVNSRLQLTYKAEMKDPSLPAPGLFQIEGNAGIPTLASKNGNDYDVAIGIHPGIINGMLRRSYEKGYLNTLDIGEKNPAEMTKPFVFSFDPALGTNYARIHVAIKYDVRGFNSLFFTRDMPMEFDLKARIETDGKNNLEIVAEEVIEDSIMIDKKAAWIFRGKAESRATNKLLAKKEEYSKTRKVLGAIPSMDDLFGIPLRLKDVKTDSGAIVMFSDFDPHK